MKDLNTYINEGLFKNVGIGSAAVKQEIIDRVSKLYNCDNITIEYVGGKCYVDVDDVLYPKGSTFETFQDDKYELRKVGGIMIYHAPKLKSLIGMPKEVVGDVGIHFCDGIKNLSGMPEKITGGNVEFTYCSGLKDLSGMSPIVEGLIRIEECNNLININCPNTKCQTFRMLQCPNLKHPKGCPIADEIYFTSVGLIDLKTIDCPTVVLLHCLDLKTLKGLTATKMKSLRLDQCETLNNLIGCPNNIGWLLIKDMGLKSTEGAPKECLRFTAENSLTFKQVDELPYKDKERI